MRTDVSSDKSAIFMLDVGDDMSTNVEISAAAVAFNLGLKVSHAMVLTELSTGAIVGVVPDVTTAIAVMMTALEFIAFEFTFDVSHAAEMLTGVIMDGTIGIAAEVAVMTALEFTLPAPLEDSSISC